MLTSSLGRPLLASLSCGVVTLVLLAIVVVDADGVLYVWASWDLAASGGRTSAQLVLEVEGRFSDRSSSWYCSSAQTERSDD